PIRVHFYYTGSANALSAHPCFSQKVVFSTARAHRDLHSFPTRRSSDLIQKSVSLYGGTITRVLMEDYKIEPDLIGRSLELYYRRSEEHTSELQSRENLVCRLLLEKKNSHEENYCNECQLEPHILVLADM